MDEQLSNQRGYKRDFPVKEDFYKIIESQSK